MQNPAIGRTPIRLNAVDDARRLGMILFENKVIFENEPFRKSHLRQPTFYRDLLDLANRPGNRKCSQIFDAYQNLVNESREL